MPTQSAVVIFGVGCLDRQLTQKYDMSFDQFERQQITLDKGFTWEVECDAIAWETAVDGIRTVQRQLSELLNGDD